MFFFDPVYFLFALPPMVLMIYAQIKVRSTYNKYQQVRNMSVASPPLFRERGKTPSVFLLFPFSPFQAPGADLVSSGGRHRVAPEKFAVPFF